MRTLRSLWVTSVTAAAMGVPMLATADSGVGSGSADANLDFRVEIYDVVEFRIGDGLLGTPGGNVNTVDFTLDGVNDWPGSGAVTGVTDYPVSPGGNVQVELRANSDSVQIAAVPLTANLDNGSGNTIPWTEIQIFDGGTITAPANAAATSTGIDARGGVTDDWSFSYMNADPTVPPGIYGNGGGGHARVTFTASASNTARAGKYFGAACPGWFHPNRETTPADRLASVVFGPGARIAFLGTPPLPVRFRAGRARRTRRFWLVRPTNLPG